MLEKAKDNNSDGSEYLPSENTDGDESSHSTDVDDPIENTGPPPPAVNSSCD